MKFWTLAWMMLILGGESSCGLDSPDGTSPDNSSQGIIGGSRFNGLPAVGALHYQGHGHCSGTLIEPRIVLTAGHCVADFIVADMQFLIGSNSFLPEFVLSVSSMKAHPDYDPGDDWHPPVNDVGLVFLTEDAPVEPLGTLSLMDDSWVGTKLFFVGYGVTDGYTQTGSGYKRSVEMRITEVDDKTFSALEPKKSLCNGDSGGPGFFIDDLGNYLVAGVASYGPKYCNGESFDTRVDAFQDFIGEETKPGCHGETPEGRCDANIRIWCENNVVHQKDCAAQNKQCAFNQTAQFYDCLPPVTKASCQGETAGRCEGDTLITCRDQKIVKENCALIGKLCIHDSVKQNYICDSPPSLDLFCQDKNGAGGCTGNVLIWCGGGQVMETNCTAQNKQCGYNKSTKKYDCLLLPSALKPPIMPKH